MQMETAATVEERAVRASEMAAMNFIFAVCLLEGWGSYVMMKAENGEEAGAFCFLQR